MPTGDMWGSGVPDHKLARNLKALTEYEHIYKRIAWSTAWRVTILWLIMQLVLFAGLVAWGWARRLCNAITCVRR